MPIRIVRPPRTRARQAKYKKKLYRRWRLAGLCVRCGAETGKPRPDGKPYSECWEHRFQTAATHRVAIARRRRWVRRGWAAAVTGGPRSSLL